MVQVHANMAHAKHAAVNEQARRALKEELSNEYQLYHYVRFLYIIIPGNSLWNNSIWSPLLGIEKIVFDTHPFDLLPFRQRLEKQYAQCTTSQN